MVAHELVARVPHGIHTQPQAAPPPVPLTLTDGGGRNRSSYEGIRRLTAIRPGRRPVPFECYCLDNGMPVCRGVWPVQVIRVYRTVAPRTGA